MSNIIHYIDTSLGEPSQARVKSLTNRAPEAFPVLVYGDVRSHNFIFHYAGTVEPFSGNANYSLRVTVGNARLGPTGGTYTLTCGTTTAALDSQSDAQAIQYALNQLATVGAAGGVTVTGKFPVFMVAWNSAGAQTALTAAAALLVPASAITIASVQTGDATHVQISSLTIRQAVIVQQTNWAVSNSPSNGWTGSLSTNGANAFPFMDSAPVDAGGLLQARTLLTVEVLDTNANAYVSYFQAPVIVRVKPTA